TLPTVPTVACRSSPERTTCGRRRHATTRWSSGSTLGVRSWTCRPQRTAPMKAEEADIPEPPKPRRRRNVAVIGFPDQKDENRARAEWPFEIALIYLDACLVDDTFQRPPQRVFVKFLIEAFDETLVGCIAVNERKNGFLSILDGQQRYL